MGKFSDFLDYFKLLKNPISCLLFKFGLKKKIIVKPKNTDKYAELHSIKDINMILGYLHGVNRINEFMDFFNSYLSDDKILKWDNINIPNFRETIGLGSFFELFLTRYWNTFDIDYNNRCIIDIGSNGGDSTLYFASEGAKVYGFEPVKPLYEYSLEVLKLNPQFRDKVQFFNQGVSDKAGKIKIDTMDSVSDYISDDSYEVDVVTIDDILSNNNIKPDFLKMDCEGCEFNIILNTDLSEFKDILFEHHSEMVGKNYNILIEKLEAQGFKIKKYPVFNLDFEKLGIIHAYK